MSVVDVVAHVARVKTLAAFMRSQANLTDGHPASMGPGSVNLNHEEAMMCVLVLDAFVETTEQELPRLQKEFGA